MPKQGLELFPGCTHRQTPAADVIQWSNWEIRKGRTQWLSLVGLVVGVGVLLFVWLGIRSYWDGDTAGGGWTANGWRIGGVGVLVFIFAGLVGGMALNIAQLVRRQTVLVSDDLVSFYEVGRWRTYRRQYVQGEVLGLFFGKVEGDTSQAAEPQLFLVCRRELGEEGRVWRQTVQTRLPLAGWMHTADQRLLFNRLREIFKRRQWSITIEDEEEEREKEKEKK